MENRDRGGVTTTRAAVASAGLLAVMAVAVILLLPAHTVTPEPHLAAPQHLSSTAKSLLDQRMARHGADMAELDRAVIFLDLLKAAKLADHIAAEPTLARPTGTDANELNAQLPERFFQLQDELKGNAARLASAARGYNIDDLAQAHAQVVRTCVACHGVYRDARPPAHTP
jgi:cytochrome c556